MAYHEEGSTPFSRRLDIETAYEKAAKLCEQLGEKVYRDQCAKANKGIGILWRRHYQTCANAIRGLRDTTL